MYGIYRIRWGVVVFFAGLRGSVCGSMVFILYYMGAVFELVIGRVVG